ncbi:MAG: ABC transporter permease [Calditrichaeota bacterium]|nr:MAG: ABC transporter permease [Calditrichota bacterium]
MAAGSRATRQRTGAVAAGQGWTPARAGPADGPPGNRHAGKCPGCASQPAGKRVAHPGRAHGPDGRCHRGRPAGSTESGVARTQSSGGAPMNALAGWISENSGLLLRLSLLHLGLVAMSVFLAAAVAVPLAVALTRPRWQRYARNVLDVVNVLQTVPGLALIGFASALWAWLGEGIGWWPALTALVAYALLPLFSNALTGIGQVPSAVRRSAEALGLAERQIWWQVELPLSWPALLAGLRTAVVFNVGTAALAAAIGADCLGTLIFQGIATGNTTLLLAGALPTALMALLLELLFALLQKRLFPRRMAAR